MIVTLDSDTFCLRDMHVGETAQEGDSSTICRMPRTLAGSRPVPRCLAYAAEWHYRMRLYREITKDEDDHTETG